MKRLPLILISLTLVSGVVLALLLVNSTPAVGGPGFSNRDLSEVYVYNLIGIFGLPPNPTDFCEHAGTMSFDGVGAVTIDAVIRCGGSVLSPPPITLNYSVNADGSFSIITPASIIYAHGQIVDHGRSLLLDGTTRTHPEVVVFHGVAMQR